MPRSPLYFKPKYILSPCPTPRLPRVCLSRLPEGAARSRPPVFRVLPDPVSIASSERSLESGARDTETRIELRPEVFLTRIRLGRRMLATLGVAVPAAVLAVGLLVGPLRSAEWRWRTPLLAEVQSLAALDPVRALPRTEAVLATLEAQRHMSAGRPYAAWQALRTHLDVDGVGGPPANLLAARAAMAWGGWSQARTALADRPWLAQASAGEGLYLLARAEEELGNLPAATRAYSGYLAVPAAREKAQANARLAGILSRRGQYPEAAAAYAAAAAELPEVADWLRTLQLEQLVAAGDPAAPTVAAGMSGGNPSARMRRAELEAEAWVTAARTDQAIARLDVAARQLNAEGARLEGARLNMNRARLLLGSTQPDAARGVLISVAADGGAPAAQRLEAAQALGELTGRSAADEIIRADAYEAASRPGLAARSLRAALEAGASDTPEQRLRLARLLYEARDYAPARAAYLRAAEVVQDREARAHAELHAARSLFRTGGTARAQQTAKQNAMTEFRRVADQYDGTAAAGTALFLLGDEAPSNQAGVVLYRRAAAIASSPDAREALFRVGDRSLRMNETAAAIRAWEDYVARYPRGEQTARVAYDVGKLHLAAGRRAQAQAMFTAAMLAEPTSYYATRAGERIGANPIDHVLAEPRPWVGLASEPAEAAAVLHRLDRLAELGLTEARDAEYQAALHRFERKPFALLVLAEGMRDRLEPIEGIRLGRRLLQEREGVWDERLLRLVFPFPYRELIVDESRRAGVDPILYAALVRQESSFRADARSWVGATGLGQIMPATGRWLAPMVGIRDYEQSLLEVPEVNLRMGTRYLADLLRRYDGAADLALAGYNAGPGRADRWRREFNYGRDTDAFRAAIPFDETRNYVMIVLRNEMVYRRLYGAPRAPGSTIAD